MTNVCGNDGWGVLTYNHDGSRFAPPLSFGHFPSEPGKPDWRVGYLRLSRYSCIVASVGG